MDLHKSSLIDQHQNKNSLSIAYELILVLFEQIKDSHSRIETTMQALSDVVSELALNITTKADKNDLENVISKIKEVIKDYHIDIDGKLVSISNNDKLEEVLINQKMFNDKLFKFMTVIGSTIAVLSFMMAVIAFIKFS